MKTLYQEVRDKMIADERASAIRYDLARVASKPNYARRRPGMFVRFLTMIGVIK